MHRIVKVSDSKVINHYSECMNGNSTIRAFDSTEFAISKDYENNNESLLA